MQLFSLALMLVGIYGLITKQHIMKIIISLNIMELGLNLFIISIGYKEGFIAPILTKVYASSDLNFVDPLPQALVLTSIVIGVGTTALALAFARKLYQEHGTLDLGEIGVLK